jgi:hypothetical protein
MSSPASVLTVELPRWLLADRLSLGLACATAPVIELVLARHPGAPTGVGIVVAALLVAGVWWQRRGRPRALEFGPAGASLRQAPGTRQAFDPGPGCRLLGGGVVIHWRSPGRSGVLWLTPADLPRATLRSLSVRLVTGR